MTPKQNFLKLHAKEAELLKASLNDRWFRVAVDYALAQMTTQSPSAEEIKGARRLIGVLLDLPEIDKETTRLPVTTLDSYEPKED